MQIHSANALILHVGNQQATPTVQEHVVGFPQHGLISGAAIAAIALLPRACKGGDAAGVAINLAHDGIAPFSYIDIPVGVDRQGIGHVERGLERRAAIAAVPTIPGASYQSDDAGVGVHAADPVVLSHTYKHMALGVEGAHIGGFAGRLNRGTAVTTIALLPVAENSLDDTLHDGHSHSPVRIARWD